MAETYLEITQQIEALKQKAESIREAEIAGVIERIKSAIDVYGLTPEQLFEPARQASRSAPAANRVGRSPAAASRGAGPKYRDDEGNVWSGRGPRPRWLKAALSAGRSLEDFAVHGHETSTPSRAARLRPSNTPKYKDGEGHVWSGRGPRPRWVKAALEAGKTLDQLT